MKVNLKRFKIEKAASKDESRPILQQTFLDAGQAMLVATDSRICAAVPVELAMDDVSGFVPVEAIALARKDQRKRDAAEIAANGMVSVALGNQRAEFERYMPETFPDWTKAIPKGKTPLLSFGLDPEQLKRLGDALGGGWMRLDIFGADKPIRVVPMGVAGELGAKGVLSPVIARGED